MFREMQLAVQNEVCRLIPHIGAGAFAQEEERLREVEKQALTLTSPAGDESSPLAKTDEEKVGRNDPCPCGSGKKYKKCCADK